MNMIMNGCYKLVKNYFLHLFVVRHHAVFVNNIVPDPVRKTPQLHIPKALSSLLHVDFAEIKDMVQI